MLITDLYKTIDSEISNLIERYKGDDNISRHPVNSPQQKSYGLLIWFLDFYGNNAKYNSAITEGADDYSCDLIQEGKNTIGEKVFYVLQSKWNNEKKSKATASRDEILKSISDFNTLLAGKAKPNANLAPKVDALLDHLRSNGEVKFIFLSLAQYKGGADEAIETFKRQDEKIDFEVIDLLRIRTDYIDRKFKQITPINPLLKFSNPEEAEITLEFVQKDRNLIKIERPFEAYQMLVRPGTLYKLFLNYGFSLFFKNVRNPLLESNFNEEIEKTVSDNPSFFWYYNNGITAITTLLPSIGSQAEIVKLTGLQIINGAQTIYAIYRAYKKASPTQRTKMDQDALISFRLLKSGGKNFDLDVTRYTNSQNPVTERDFHANDEVQIRLQNESFDTNYWYEKRRGEFRQKPESVTIIPNSELCYPYLAFHFEMAQEAWNNLSSLNAQDLLFASSSSNPNGLYESVFGRDTKFVDMLSSLLILEHLERTLKFNNTEYLFYLLSLLGNVYRGYVLSKFGETCDPYQRIYNLFQKSDSVEVDRCILYLQSYLWNWAEIPIAATGLQSLRREFESVAEALHLEKTPAQKIDLL